jgi:hypothetical protein
LFNEGNFEKHDSIVMDDILRLDEKGVDCVLMGQIPFALMEDKLKAMRLKTPILYAGRDAFRKIGELLGPIKERSE